MLIRSLVTLGAVLMTGTALAQDITSVADFTTDKANDLRGLAYGADGKIYVSGHLGDPSAETNPTTVVVVGRLNADGTPDTTFGDGGFATVDLGPGVEQSLAVAPLANGEVVAAVNATEEDGGISVFLVKFDATGKQVTGDAWGGETGAVEVVFGWANAANDGFPGVDNPPQDTAWDLKVDNSSGTEKLVVAGHGSAVEGSGRTDADRFVTRLLAADGSVDPAFNGGKPYTYHSAQAFNEGGRRVTIGTDGSIMSAGYTNLGDALRNHVILIHLNADGTLDEGFGGFVTPESSATAVGLTATPGVAVFNPFVGDGGFAECYAAVQLSDGSWVTTGYGGATGEGVASTLGFKTTEAPDIVSFKVKGTALDTTYGGAGQVAVQSEGLGLTTAEDRGRLLVALPGDRTLHVGYFGGIPSAVVLDASGKPDTSVSEDGILALPNDTVGAQFFGAVVSPDGKNVALSTNNNKAGARVVVLELQS